MNLPNPYLGGNYRRMMALPLLLLAVSAFLAFVSPGLQPGIDLRGGILVTVQSATPIDADALRAALAKHSSTVEVRTFSSGGGSGVEIELENNPILEKAEEDVQALVRIDSELSSAELAAGSASTATSPAVEALRAQILSESRRILASLGSTVSAGNDAHAAVSMVQQEHASAKQRYRTEIIGAVRAVAASGDISFREVGSSLSKFFIAKTREIVLFAFILSAIVIFVVFRSIVPSLAVIFGAIADLTLTMGVMALTGIPLGLATVATLLMLIGFSLDTNIMLTMRVIKRREGTPAERAFEAMQTGFLMNLTTIGAFGALWMVSQWLQIPIYGQIGSVAMIGGFANFVATWLFNAPLVLWHVRKQEKN